MPYILFNKHHWQRATDQKTQGTVSLHNPSSVSEGQLMLTRIKLSLSLVFISIFANFWTLTLFCTHFVTFRCSDHNLQTPRLKKSPINSISVQSISVHNIFKTQWTRWIVSLWEQAAGSLFLSSLCYSSSQARFLSSLSRFQPIKPKTYPVTLKLHQSKPIHTKIPKLDYKPSSNLTKTFIF